MDKRKKIVTFDEIVMVPNWTETFLNIKVGQSLTFRRPFFTTARARSLATRLNTRTDMKFSVSAGELDEYCVVKRLK